MTWFLIKLHGFYFLVGPLLASSRGLCTSRENGDAVISKRNLARDVIYGQIQVLAGEKAIQVLREFDCLSWERRQGQSKGLDVRSSNGTRKVPWENINDVEEEKMSKILLKFDRTAKKKRDRV